MKARRILYLTAIITALSSCKKYSFDVNIVGKWQIQQRYNGYANGGDFTWHTIPDDQRSVIAFREDSTFTQQNPPVVSSLSPTGRYSFASSSRLVLTSTCNCYPPSLGINVDNGTMTLTYLVTEGEIRERYTRVN